MKTEWKTFLADAGAEFDGDSVLHYGNPALEQEVVLSGTVFADLGHLGVISAQGKDAADFLQAQLSNDVHELDEGQSQISAYCTPKGRVLAVFRIFRRDGGYYLRLPADILESVLKRLRMYVLRADVTLEDASEAFIRIGVSGEAAAEELAAVSGVVPERPNATLDAGDLTIFLIPSRHPRFEVYATSLDSARQLWDALNVRGAPIGIPAWQLLDIEAGLANVHAGTADLFVPQMLNLHLTGGVNFKKGCYPGQEIVARTHYLGKLKRRMYLGRIEGDQQAMPGDALYSGKEGEQAVGTILESRPHPDGGQAALAVIQSSSIEGGELHHTGPEGPAFTIGSLPYSFEE